MNDEETRSAPVTIKKDQEILTGRKAANCFIDNNEQVSNIIVPEEKKHQLHEEVKSHQEERDPSDYMSRPFNKKEFEEALSTLKR